MSLINQMLRDLDNRQQPLSATTNSAVLSGIELTALCEPAPDHTKRHTLTGSVLMVLALLTWAWTTDHPGIGRIPGDDDNHMTRIKLELPQAGTLIGKAPLSQITLDTTSVPQADAAPRDTAKKTEPPVEVQTAKKAKHEVATPVTGDSGKQATETVMPVNPPQPASSPAREIARQDGVNHIEIVERPQSPEQRAERLYLDAHITLREGDVSAAMTLLRQAMAADSSHHPSRLLLASLYIKQQDKRAGGILAEGLEQDPTDAPMAMLYAQLLSKQDRESVALRILQDALPGNGGEARHHALLAGLYQRTGESRLAAEHYQKALKISPGHGEWWMGLGISQEQLGDVAAARSAYTNALRFSLKAALQEYIKARLAILAR